MSVNNNTTLFNETSIIKKIHLTGNSMCMRERREGGYIGTFRNMNNNPLNTTNCWVINNNVIAYFDNEFNVISGFELDENLKTVPRFTNYTKGLEDIRIIGDNNLISGSLDTNPDWLCEIVYSEFSHETHKLTKLVRLHIEGNDRIHQKNWTVLKKNGDKYDILYWYNPFIIVSLNVSNGIGVITKKYSVHALATIKAHGGACIYLEKYNQFLVLIRIFDEHETSNVYKSSRWLLLDDTYEVCGLSTIGDFNFECPGKKRSNIYYELCISLILKGDDLYLPVTINECNKYIYKISLSDLMNTFYEVKDIIYLPTNS
jgi:hypothetical protein